ncbi:MAG: invasion associated locus B family protein [Parvibaculaceae bacterium]|nr:invasion associated locus B family protein [Parvibaculaceae bacterium]
MSLRRALSGVSLAAAVALSAFSPAQAQGAGGDEAKVQKFGTWSSRCETGETGVEQCHAFVGVGVGDEAGQQQRILYLGIGYGARDVDNDGSKDLFMFAITPLGTVLPVGIKWTIDGGEEFGQQFLYCLPGGCQTEILIDEKRLKALQSGKEMNVEFRLVRQGEVKIPVKLDGITKAIGSLPKPKS